MGVLSLDLRERVLAAYDRSGHKSQTCAEFGIARTTLDKWLKLRERTGSLRQRDWRRGRTTLIQDWAGFEAFVNASTFDTVKQLSVLYEAHFGESITQPRLWRALRHIGWTPKKRVSATVKPIAADRRSSTG